MNKVSLPLASFVLGIAVASYGETPDAFLDYIDALGATVIDTGVMARPGTKAECDIAWLKLGLNEGSNPEWNDCSILGARGSSTADTRFLMCHGSNGHFGFGYASTYRSNIKEVEVETRYKVVSEINVGSQTLDIDDERVYSGSSTDSIDTGCNLYLFAANVGGTTNYRSQVRCYGVKIWQDGGLVRDYRPCVKDGRPGLYDDVGKTISYGAFAVSDKPDYYVDYVEANGTQFIDTGIRARAPVVAEGEMSWTSIPAESTYFGACKSDGSSRFYMLHSSNSSGTRWAACSDDSAGRGNATGTWVPGTKYAFSASFISGAQSIEIDGATVWSKSLASVSTPSFNLYLFACNKGGNPNYLSHSRCYGLALTQDGDQKRDFKPCVKWGKGCLYDTVSRRLFFPNVPFADSHVGKVADLPTHKATMFVEYIESDSTGMQFIDTGIIGRNDTKAEIVVEWPVVNNADECVLGCRNTSSHRFFLLNAPTAYLGIGYDASFLYVPNTLGGNGSQTANRFTPVANTEYRIVTELARGKQTCTVNGTLLYSSDDAPSGQVSSSWNSDFSAGCTIYLFACNDNGKVVLPGRVRVKSLKLWQDGNLVRHYRPVLTKKGAVVMWEKIQNCLVDNSGDNRFYSHGAVSGELPPSATMLYMR